MTAAHKTKQELVNYLVTAVEEQDVVFVLWWLSEMRQQATATTSGNEVGEGVVQPHSWKAHSALAAAVRLSSTPPHRLLILQILLCYIEEPTDADACDVAVLEEKEWAEEEMRCWTVGGREKADAARMLVDLLVSEAAEWLDDNLEPHPFQDSLTGDGPLPPPPASSLSSALPSVAVTESHEAAPASSPPHPFSLAHPSSVIDLTSPSPPAATPVVETDSAFNTGSTFSPDVVRQPLRLRLLSSLSSPVSRLITRSSVPCSYSRPQIQPSSTFLPKLVEQPLQHKLPPKPAVPPLVHCLIKNLPLSITSVDLHALVRQSSEDHAASLRFNYSPGSSSCTVTLIHYEAYLKLRRRLHLQSVSGHSLHVQLAPPTSDNPPSNPFLVFVSHLPLAYDLDDFHTLVRLTRAGAFDIELYEVEAVTVGVFKVALEETAREVAGALNGRVVDDHRVTAYWAPEGASATTSRAMSSSSSSQPVLVSAITSTQQPPPSSPSRSFLPLPPSFAPTFSTAAAASNSSSPISSRNPSSPASTSAYRPSTTGTRETSLTTVPELHKRETEDENEELRAAIEAGKARVAAKVSEWTRRGGSG
ncbi:hypothetical protein JCM8097_004156 [Rhodosporidiobolus ruineniae]